MRPLDRYQVAPTRLFLGFVALALAGVVPRLRAGGAPPARPDIVFIMADDLGWGDVGFHGGNAPTPHLDRLAREGPEPTRPYVGPALSPTPARVFAGRRRG